MNGCRHRLHLWTCPSCDAVRRNLWLCRETERAHQLRRIEQMRDAEGSAYEPGELGGAA